MSGSELIPIKCDRCGIENVAGSYPIETLQMSVCEQCLVAIQDEICMVLGTETPVLVTTESDRQEGSQ